MTRLFIFGATGQVARCIIAKASEAGVSSTALSRRDVDLTDPAAVRAAIQHAPNGSVVVNAAAYTAVDRAESEPELADIINAQAPGAMAIACAERRLPFIHISTDYVFDGKKSTPYVESDSTNPQGVYGRSKRDGECRVLEAHSSSLVLRTSWVYSAHANNFVKTMLRVGAEREELSVVDDQVGCPTSAVDIATAILTAARSFSINGRQGGIYHFSGTGETSWAGFAEEIFAKSKRLGGPVARVRRIPSKDYPVPAKRPANSRLSSDLFASHFECRAPAWQESLSVVLEELLAA